MRQEKKVLLKKKENRNDQRPQQPRPPPPTNDTAEEEVGLKQMLFVQSMVESKIRKFICEHMARRGLASSKNLLIKF